jgi:hypothetical protein
MGYALCLGPCYGCGTVFSFNPNVVPSIRVDGTRHPICQSCVNRANPERIKRGLEPITVLPGAYEPVDEAEL